MEQLLSDNWMLTEQIIQLHNNNLMQQSYNLILESELENVKLRFTDFETESLQIQNEFQQKIDNLLISHNVLLSEEKQKYLQLQTNYRTINNNLLTDYNTLLYQIQQLKETNQFLTNQLNYNNRSVQQLQKYFDIKEEWLVILYIIIKN